jgi:hypothetical protein
MSQTDLSRFKNYLRKAWGASITCGGMDPSGRVSDYSNHRETDRQTERQTDRHKQNNFVFKKDTGQTDRQNGRHFFSKDLYTTVAAKTLLGRQSKGAIN